MRSEGAAQEASRQKLPLKVEYSAVSVCVRIFRVRTLKVERGELEGG